MTYAFITAAEAAATIHHGDTVGIGGFSSVGTPKAVPEALAAYAEAQHAQGKEFKVGLITGGATGCQVDSALVKAHAVSFRTKCSILTSTSRKSDRTCVTVFWGKST